MKNTLVHLRIEALRIKLPLEETALLWAYRPCVGMESTLNPLKGDKVYEKIKGWMDDDGGPLPCSRHRSSCLGSGRD